MWPNPKFPADLVTFTEEIFNGNLHFLCSVALRWNGTSETSNKEAELSTFWFWEKIDWQAWVEDWKRRLLDFTGRAKRWDVRKGAQVGFKLLDLMTQGIE